MSFSEPSWPGAVLFDLDGTLIDSVPDITLAVNELMALDGIAPFEEADVRRMVGHGVEKLVERAYAARGGVPDDLPERMVVMRGIYGRHLTGRTVLMPGVRETIAGLRRNGWLLAVVTNKLQSAAETVIEHFGLRTAFAAIVGDGEGIPLKPAPDLLLAALEQMRVPAARAVMVGDSSADIQSAHAARVRSVAVRGGYTPTAPEALGADAVIDNLTGVPGVLPALL